nr:unnamed protein product [Callosobruchus analis]
MAPAAASKKSSTSKVVKRAAKSTVEADDIEEWKKAKQLLKPKDQLELNELGAFIPLPSPGNVVVTFESQGTLLHKDSEEAHQQMLEMGIDRTYFT